MKKNVTKKDLILEIKTLEDEKKELEEELKTIKEWFCLNEVEENFIEIIYKKKRILNISKKICYTLAILFLCASCYILGLLR